MPESIEEFFARYPSDIQAISLELRSMVRATMPQANEILYASQNHVGYSLGQSSHDLIIYICPMQDYVRLGFMYGSYLPDPDHLLEGTGKRLRHVKVRTLEGAVQRALKQLVEAAWTEAGPRMKKP